MTLKAFFFLFAVTVVAVVCSAFIAERLLAPGFERGIVIAVLSGLVVFPAARWAEYRGWIKGTWSPGGDMRKAADKARAEKAAAEAAARESAEPPAAGAQSGPVASDPASVIHAPADATRQAGRTPSSGDPR